MLEHETLEEQLGCHSSIGTNDGYTMTTAVEVKDERRRQKRTFNKTEDSTKFLDASRSVAQATAGISSADWPAREIWPPRCALFLLRRNPAFVPRKRGRVPPPLEKTDETDRLKAGPAAAAVRTSLLREHESAPLFFAPSRGKKPAGAVEVLLTRRRTLLQKAGFQFTNPDDVRDERSETLGPSNT